MTQRPLLNVNTRKESACRGYIEGKKDAFLEWLDSVEDTTLVSKELSEPYNSPPEMRIGKYTDITVFEAAVSDENANLVKRLLATPGCDWLCRISGIFKAWNTRHPDGTPTVLAWLFTVTFTYINVIIEGCPDAVQCHIRKYLAENLPGVTVIDDGKRFGEDVDLDRRILSKGTVHEYDMLRVLGVYAPKPEFAKIIFEFTELDPFNYKGIACISGIVASMVGRQTEKSMETIRIYTEENERSKRKRCDPKVFRSIRRRILNPASDDSVLMRLQKNTDPGVGKFKRFISVAGLGMLHEVRCMIAQGDILKNGDVMVEALCTAIKFNRTEVAKFMLESGAYTADEKSILPLQGAVIAGNMELVKAILVDPNVTASRMEGAAIVNACQHNRTEIAMFLLQRPDVDPSVRNSSCLRWAVQNGNVDLFAAIIVDTRVDPSAQDNQAVRQASARGHVAILRMLLSDPRVDASACDNRAFRLAAKFGHSEVVRILLTRPEVDTNSRDSFALQVAEERGHSDVVEMLRHGTRLAGAL